MTASTSTAWTCAFLKDWWSTNKIDSIRKHDQTAMHRLLDKFISDHHHVFHIQYRDQPHVLARVLVALHELGASQDELFRGYCNAFPTLIPFALHSAQNQASITIDTWQSQLGDASYYQAYLTFFSGQVAMYGIDAVVDAFFIRGPLSASIGGRLQPFVHLTFGIKYAMPHIVAQSMAYLATTHLDASFLMLDDSDQPHRMGSGLDPATVLLEQIAIDPRFAGRMAAADLDAYKLLIKSQGVLLRTYMRQCIHPTPADDLIRLAIRLVGNPTIRLSVSTQLLEAARSIDLWPTGIRPKLAQLVLLAMFCTFVVEKASSSTCSSAAAAATTGSTTSLKNAVAVTSKPTVTWEQCAKHIKTLGNPTLILLFQNFVKLSKGNDIAGSDLLRLMDALVTNNSLL